MTILFTHSTRYRHHSSRKKFLEFCVGFTSTQNSVFVAAWRNWQTHLFWVLVGDCSSGFESRRGHIFIVNIHFLSRAKITRIVKLACGT